MELYAFSQQLVLPTGWKDRVTVMKESFGNVTLNATWLSFGKTKVCFFNLYSFCRYYSHMMANVFIIFVFTLSTISFLVPESARLCMIGCLGLLFLATMLSCISPCIEKDVSFAFTVIDVAACKYLIPFYFLSFPNSL